MIRASFPAVSLLAALLAATSTTALAGGDKVAFPENYDKGVLYTTVDRYDIKQYRELYAPKAAVDAAKAGKPIPSGTVLTLIQYKAKLDDAGNPVVGQNGRFLRGDLVAYAVMEKRAGWGTEYSDDVRNGEWEYQAFTADRKVNDKAKLDTCFACHKPHEAIDFVISAEKMKGQITPAVATAAPSKAGGIMVAIKNFMFGPDKIEAKVGQTVTWTNGDDSPHQITLTGPKGKRSGIIQKGRSDSLTFTEAGTYGYICGLHPNMKGTIEVK